MDDGVEQCCGVGDSRCVIVVIGAVGALVGVGGVVVVERVEMLSIEGEIEKR